MCKENNPLSCLWKCTLATDNNIWIVSECTNNKKKAIKKVYGEKCDAIKKGVYVML